MDASYLGDRGGLIGVTAPRTGGGGHQCCDRWACQAVDMEHDLLTRVSGADGQVRDELGERASAKIDGLELNPAPVGRIANRVARLGHARAADVVERLVGVP